MVKRWNVNVNATAQWTIIWTTTTTTLTTTQWATHQYYNGHQNKLEKISISLNSFGYSSSSSSSSVFSVTCMNESSFIPFHSECIHRKDSIVCYLSVVWAEGVPNRKDRHINSLIAYWWSLFSRTSSKQMGKKQNHHHHHHRPLPSSTFRNPFQLMILFKLWLEV